MPSLISRPIIVLGALLLFHACYSAYEQAKFNDILLPRASSSFRSDPSTPSAAAAATSLPLDISLETITSVLLVCVGLVLGADELHPISWRVWARNAESVSRGGGGGPFRALEDRAGFVDIRAKRKQFADWVRDERRGGDGGEGKVEK